MGEQLRPSIAQIYMCTRGRVLPSGRSICIILFSLLIRIVQWGALAQWLERATDNRVLTGSNPAEAVRKLLQTLPHFASVFSEETLKAVGPFLPCAIINRSEVKYLTWAKCVTFRGFHNYIWSIMYTGR